MGDRIEIRQLGERRNRHRDTWSKLEAGLKVNGGQARFRTGARN